MSVGPLGGLPAAAAGSQLAQTSGSEVERSQQETSNQARRTQSDAKAEAASGIAATDGEETETEERDADGRRLWEAPEEHPHEPEASGEDTTESERQSKDASGQSGNQLDLTG